ncbi:MAG TPA: twin-arginine translocase TatA/TatE family subunit [Candidatus Limnocylindrales bacterium]
MGGITPAHLVLILIVALLVIGPGKLPETGAALGKAIRQFRDAASGIADEASSTTAAATGQQPAAPVAPAPTQASTADPAGQSRTDSTPSS